MTDDTVYDKLNLIKIKGDDTMKEQNESNEYERLFELYNKKSDEELSGIIKPENGYTEIAIKVASDILQSDRTVYHEEINKIDKQFGDDIDIDRDNIILNIQNDIHSIKNMLLFFVILTVIGLLFGIYTIFIAIPSLF